MGDQGARCRVPGRSIRSAPTVAGAAHPIWLRCRGTTLTTSSLPPAHHRAIGSSLPSSSNSPPYNRGTSAHFAGEDRELVNSWLARVTLAVVPAQAAIYLVHLIVLAGNWCHELGSCRRRNDSCLAPPQFFTASEVTRAKRHPRIPGTGTCSQRMSIASRGESAQPSPVRPFLEIAFDEVGIVAAVTANQAKTKAGEVIAPSPASSGLVTRQTARIARRLDLIAPQRLFRYAPQGFLRRRSNSKINSNTRSKRKTGAAPSSCE